MLGDLRRRRAATGRFRIAREEVRSWASWIDIENPTREQAEERMKVAHPLRVPYVEAQDISNAILFLASDDARYVTAEVFHVSAGLMATNIA